MDPFTLARSTADRLVAGTAATSVFVYGSVARGDDTSDSDVELGVVATPGGVTRRQLVQHLGSGVRAYPFTVVGLLEALPDVPFPGRVFTAELAVVARTVAGAPVVEHLPRPAARRRDLHADVDFHLGVAVGAIGALRASGPSAAAGAAVKAGFAAARVLTALRAGRLVFGYGPRDYDVPAHVEELLVRLAGLRAGRACDSDVLFEVLSVLRRDCAGALDASGLPWSATLVPAAPPRRLPAVPQAAGTS